MRKALRALIVLTAAGGLIGSLSACRKEVTSHEGTSNAGSAGAGRRLDGQGGNGLGASGRAAVLIGGSGGVAGASAGDPGWQDATWDPDCPDFEVATKPEHAVPALEWEACTGVAGCERMAVTWRSTLLGSPYMPFQQASVAALGGTVYLSMHMRFEEEWRKAVYENARTPVAAWRGHNGSGQCGGVYTGTNASGVCLLMGKSPEAARFVVLPLSDTAAAPRFSLATSAVASDGGCTNELFTGLLSAGTEVVFHFARNQEFTLQPPSGTNLGGRPHGGSILFPRSDTSADGQRAVLDAWIWSPEAGYRSLIVPAGDHMVYDIRTDGAVLAWLEMPYTEDYLDTQPGELWTSSFATAESDVVRQRVRQVPETSIGSWGKVLGGGYFALVEQHDGEPDFLEQIHIYRLSDGRHWTVPMPDDVQAGGLLHIDADEIWYRARTAVAGGANRTIIRQRLASLGDGD